MSAPCLDQLQDLGFRDVLASASQGFFRGVLRALPSVDFKCPEDQFSFWTHQLQQSRRHCIGYFSEIDTLISRTVPANGRVPLRERWFKQSHMLPRTYPRDEFPELDLNEPAFVGPIGAGSAKLGRFRRRFRGTHRDADGLDECVAERKYDVSRLDQAHTLVKGIPAAVRIGLRGPHIAAPNLVHEGLVLINPPVLWGSRRRRSHTP